MRTRPFLSAREEARPFSEVLAERRGHDVTDRLLKDIDALEAEAQDAADPAERKRLQCEAEALRCALAEQPRRTR